MAEKKVTDMDSTELKGEFLELRKEQFNLRVQRGTGQLTNSSRFKVVRRQIARIKTQMSEINRITS